MAIAPPSDLMLDVARAADPAAVREATARLSRLAADPAAANEGFGKALSAAKAGSGGTASAAVASFTPAPARPAVPAGTGTLRATAQAKPDAYGKFEAVLLQGFVESMLPKDDESFGDRDSSGVYRSMMAEQLATQIAKAGGIGIAKAIAKAHPAAPAIPHIPPASTA